MCPGPGISVHRDFHVNMRCIVVLFEGFQVAVASISIGGRSSTCDRVCAHEASIHQLQMPPPPSVQLPNTVQQCATGLHLTSKRRKCFISDPEQTVGAASSVPVLRDSRTHPAQSQQMVGLHAPTYHIFERIWYEHVQARCHCGAEQPARHRRCIQHCVQGRHS